MTLEEFSEILHYQEPDFYYHGNGYTICWARGYFPDVDLGVAPFDGTGDEFRPLPPGRLLCPPLPSHWYLMLR